MALQDIAQVSISLQTTGISRQGFGTPLFITAHNYYLDLVRSYSSLSEVAEDFGTDTNAYAAATSVFGNSPAVATFKIGRQIADTKVTVTGDTSGVYAIGVTIAITVTDAVAGTVTATFTTTSGTETIATVATDLVSDINAVLGTGGTGTVAVTDHLNGTFTITKGTQDFYVSAFENTETEATNIDDTVSASNNNILNTLTDIQDVDNDWYALAWEGRALGGESIDSGTYSTVGVWDLANTIESLSPVKIYFAGSSASVSITNTYTPGTTPASTSDVLAFLAENNYFRSIGWWHQFADTTFNELEYAGYNLPFDAGSVVWGNNTISLAASKNASGNSLTSTESLRLSTRNANWAAITGDIVYTREGKVSGGEWIDIIRGRDNLQADLEADLFDLLISQQGQKIPYTDAGISLVAGVVDARLQRYKNDRNFLTDPITLEVPQAKDIANSVKITRILEDLTFTATLAGAIMLVDLQGTLTI